MTGRSVGGDIADAFACSGGGFRLLLPILLMPLRGNPREFALLTTFADVIVPDLPQGGGAQGGVPLPIRDKFGRDESVEVGAVVTLDLEGGGGPIYGCSSGYGAASPLGSCR